MFSQELPKELCYSPQDRQQDQQKQDLEEQNSTQRMEIRIPSKTFFFGEYSALVDGPALVVTGKPYFVVSLENRPLNSHNKSKLLHPDSPGGLYLRLLEQQSVLKFLWDLKAISLEEKNFLGGLGQSSAEFLALYLANGGLVSQVRNQFQKLYESNPHYQGLIPSGYDVVAQSCEGFVLFDPKQKHEVYKKWPFSDISFFLISTGIKLKTHEHLNQGPLALKGKAQALLPFSQQCWDAWKNQDSQFFVEALKNFRYGLQTFGLESLTTTQFIQRFESLPGFLCGKGCGAMGQDFFLLFCDKKADSFFKEIILSYSDIKLVEM
jgi:mevalonate kinase